MFPCSQPVWLFHSGVCLFSCGSGLTAGRYSEGTGWRQRKRERGKEEEEREGVSCGASLVIAAQPPL